MQQGGRGATLADVVAKRRDFLAVLDEEPRVKPALVEATETSRSTVDRAVAALVDAGLVTREGDDYRLTLTGRCALGQCEEYRERLSALAAARDVIDPLPQEAPLDPAALVDASIEETTPYATEAAFDAVVSRLRGADQFRAVGPAVPPRALATLQRAVDEDDLAFDLVVTPDVRSMAQHADCEQFSALAAQPTVQYHDLEESVPYALWSVTDADGSHAGFVVYTDTGPAGIVHSDTAAMTEWVAERIDAYLDRARAVGTPDLCV